MARIVVALGWSDFVLKYRGSVFGYLWSFAGPLVQFAVILGVFRPMIGTSIPYYPLYLFLGLILWEHFSLTTAACIAMPLQKIGMMQMIPLPRILFIFSVGWTHLVIVLTRLLVFFIFAWAYGVPLAFGWFSIPFLLLQSTLLSLGIGMLLGAYALQYRDVAHLWGIALQILFWLTPILYGAARTGPLTHELASFVQRGQPTFTGILHLLITFQPLSILIVDARRLLLPGEGMPSILHLVAFTAVCAAVWAAGLSVFSKKSPYFLQQY
jgi:lipopolysaccharide transport system permease protein